MTTLQQGDVKLFQTDDGGDISVIDGIVEMSGGLETSVYLALFGGNENDNGAQLSADKWWGNNSEVSERQYVSKTQFLLQSIPVNSANLRRLEDAAKNDLKYLLDLKIASSVEVFASLPSINYVNLNVKIQAQGIESEFNFTENLKQLSQT